MEKVTVIVAVFNALKALELAVMSMRHYHQGLVLWAWDNGSTDGAKEYAEKAAQRMFYGNPNVEHGYALDEMAKLVQTEFLVTIDSDVEFLRPAIDDCIAELNRDPGLFCVCPSQQFTLGTSVQHGVEMTGQPRIDPAFAVFRTQSLQEILQRVSFCVHFCYGRGQFFDVGSMIHAINPAGVLKKPELWDKIIHYGGLSTMYKMDQSPLRDEIQERMKTVEKRLKLYS